MWRRRRQDPNPFIATNIGYRCCRIVFELYAVRVLLQRINNRVFHVRYILVQERATLESALPDAVLPYRDRRCHCVSFWYSPEPEFKKFS